MSESALDVGWLTVRQSIFIVGIFVVNLLGVRVFGELEFWFSSKSPWARGATNLTERLQQA